jgi:hypothetical protein
LEEKKIEEILVVQEFFDVFPEDLQELPPNQEIEFCIELTLKLSQYLKHHTGWHQ